MKKEEVQKGKWQKEAEAYGVDLVLLGENIKMTPEERIHHHQLALTRMELLREAGKNARDRKAPSSSIRK